MFNLQILPLSIGILTYKSLLALGGDFHGELLCALSGYQKIQLEGYFPPNKWYREL